MCFLKLINFSQTQPDNTCLKILILFLSLCVRSPFHANIGRVFGVAPVEAGEGDGTPLQYSCLENPMDGGAWQAAVHGVTTSQTQLSDFTFQYKLYHHIPFQFSFLPGISLFCRVKRLCQLLESLSVCCCSVTKSCPIL